MVFKKDATKAEKPLTKTGFIRSFPESVPADDIVAKAKDAGIDLTKKFVWTIQSEMRSRAGTKGKRGLKRGGAITAKATVGRSIPKPKKAAGRKFAGPSAAPSAASKASAEQRLTALVIELGTARADEVYRSVRAKLNDLVG